MNQSHADTLKVPGATLHHEVSGAGPVLLLIPRRGSLSQGPLGRREGNL